MSENEKSVPDLSEVVSKIMEKPGLVEKIAGLISEETESAPSPAEAAEVSVLAPADGGEEGRRRQKLLGALRPYLSPERARLLDSMSAVLDLMETMGRGV